MSDSTDLIEDNYGKLESFSLEQLGIFVSILLAGTGGLLAVCFKSRCDVIETPCIKLHRKVPDETAPSEVDYNNQDNP